MERRHQAGFSLVELMIVLVVAGIILAFGAPALRRYVDSYRVRDGATQLASELRLARQKAVTNNTENWLFMAAGTSSYFTRYRTKDAAGNWSPYSSWSSWTLPTNTKFISPNFGGNTWVYFTPDGKPNQGGSAGVTSTITSVTDTVNVNVELAGSVWQ